MLLALGNLILGFVFDVYVVNLEKIMFSDSLRSLFQLKISQVLQGDFEIRDLNLLLAFQVNCPGCFIYALPLAAKVHETYGDRLNVLGLSTAFEDFELNTAENTRRLLEAGETVGMTKLYLNEHGQSPYPVPIQFPVAFDSFEPDKPSLAGHTFRVNYLRGTPSWILFDGSSTILARWFGHRTESEVMSIIDRALAPDSRYVSC